MVRPELNVAVEGTKNTASKYNENFTLMLDYIDESIQSSKDYVNSFMPSVTGQSGKFLTNDGSTASWAQVLPEGTIIFYGGYGDYIPSRWMLCDGSAVSRTTYSALFNIIGTIYGAGDGSTTFNLPNLINNHVYGTTQTGVFETPDFEAETGYESADHTHNYYGYTVDSQNSWASGGRNTAHYHIYTKGVYGLGLIPLIKY